MVIDYDKFKILEKLKKISLGNMPVFEDDLPFFKIFGDTFKEKWKMYNEDFTSSINLTKKSFVDAASGQMLKLIDLATDIIKNDLDDFEVKGTFIVDDFVYMISYCVKKGIEDNEMIFYMFDRQGVPLVYYIDSEKLKIYQHGWISNVLHKGFDKDVYHAEIIKRLFVPVVLSMFRKYANVETKTIFKKRKTIINNEKQLNNTDFDVVQLDSTWFTNLIKSEGFNVRGHFRLQPIKKQGQWTKELIWINEFQKEGYTRLAGKTKVNDNEL